MRTAVPDRIGRICRPETNRGCTPARRAMWRLASGFRAGSRKRTNGREVDSGRPAGVSTGGFPRVASRTRRARFRATGAPQAPSSTVQLGLNLPYPSLRTTQRALRSVGIHRRPPGIPASSLPTCWPPSPCARLSRARTTTGPPPHPTAIGRQRTCPPPDWLPGGKGDRGWFPRSPRNRSMREAPALTPTASPRLRRSSSTRPPHRTHKPASE